MSYKYFLREFSICYAQHQAKSLQQLTVFAKRFDMWQGSEYPSAYYKEVIQKVRYLQIGILWTPSLPCRTLSSFIQPLPPVPNYGVKQKKIFIIYGCLSISHIKGSRRVKNYSFKLFLHSILQIDKQVLTSHIGKMLKFNAFDLVI